MVELKIKQLYLSFIREISNSAGTEKYNGKEFNIKDYPKTNKILNKGIKNLHKEIVKVLKQATKKEWLQAIKKNNSLLNPYLKRKLLSQERILAYTDRNIKALQAFQNRKISGLNLSERVWRYSKQYKKELELGLELGIKDGKSADALSYDLIQFLQKPDKLYQKAKDELGFISKNQGRGVYRSSYKNAMRLTRTEINMAYRAADHEQWNRLEMVVGFEVKRSNRYYDCPVCNDLKGKYPKDFKFLGWHPHCRCYAVPILANDDEFIDWVNKLGTEDEYKLKSKNEIKNVPNNFNGWVKNNQDRINRAKNKPYFIKDNRKHIQKFKR